MTPKQGLDLIKAIMTIAEVTGESFKDLATRIVFLDEARNALVMEAVNHHNAFHEAGIVDRGKMLGLTITECTAEEADKFITDEEDEEL